MNPNRTAQFALVLGAITLAIVLVVVLILVTRPQPQPVVPIEPVDNTAAVMAELEDLRVEIATLQQSVVDTQSLVRAVLEGRGPSGGSPVPGSPDQISRQLDRLEASLATVQAQVAAICGAIESSAFAPAGFACP